MRRLATVEVSPRAPYIVRNNSAIPGFHQRGSADSEAYREGTAVPTMQAIDALPKPIVAVINECGYIDTFRAWRRGWPAERIRAVARAHGGLFVLP
jgi:hypothetical protein